jgi:hypothetical protein
MDLFLIFRIEVEFMLKRKTAASSADFTKHVRTSRVASGKTAKRWMKQEAMI